MKFEIDIPDATVEAFIDGHVRIHRSHFTKASDWEDSVLFKERLASRIALIVELEMINAPETHRDDIRGFLRTMFGAVITPFEG